MNVSLTSKRSDVQVQRLKLLECPIQFLNLKNGTYPVSIREEKLRIQIGNSCLSLHSNIISKVKEGRQITYILANQTQFTFQT